MTLEDYAQIQRELGFIEGITFESDKDGNIGNSISTISMLCKKAITAVYTENKKECMQADQIKKRG